MSERVWWFDDEAESVYRHYHHEIGKNMSAGELLLRKDREIASLKAELQGSGASQRITGGNVGSGSRELPGLQFLPPTVSAP